MEHRMNFTRVQQLHQQFQALTTYHERVQFFDHQLGLLPFDAPPFDPALPWLFDSAPAFNLLDLFLLEIDRRKNFYVKTFKFETDVFTFSINPFSKNHRITLNQFILHKFFSAFSTWEQQAARQINFFLTAEQKIKEANHILIRLREMASEKSVQPIHAKFLQVFLKGYADKTAQEQVLNRRKRFVELYLYGQGLLYAQYIELLQKKISDLKNRQQAAPPLLNQKLKVMEKLGFFDFLKATLGNEQRAKSRLIKEIHFLLSGSKSLPSNDENLLIENFLFTGKKHGNVNKPLT